MQVMFKATDFDKYCYAGRREPEIQDRTAYVYDEKNLKFTSKYRIQMAIYAFIPLLSISLVKTKSYLSKTLEKLRIVYGKATMKKSVVLEWHKVSTEG